MGGHYYSLLTIISELRKNYDITIINIGTVYAKALDRSKDKVHFLEYNGINFFSVIKRLKRICINKNIGIIHSFDIHASLFARYISLLIKIPYLSTKCGGPPPSKLGLIWKYYYPKLKILTVFNKGDYNFFKKHDAVYLIMQRVAKPNYNINDIINTNVYSFLNSEDNIKLVRIGRIGKKYHNTILQAINITNYLNKNKCKAKLAIIGYVEDRIYLEKINIYKSNNINIFTDEEATENSAKYLTTADISIGTGRNFIESCGSGCTLLNPTNNNKYPALAKKDNISIMEYYNFSDRLPIDNLEYYDYDPKIISEKLCDSIFRKKNGDIMLHIFDTNYDVNIAINKYTSIYDKIYFNNIIEDNVFDILMHFITTSIKIIKNNIK